MTLVSDGKESLWYFKEGGAHMKLEVRICFFRIWELLANAFSVSMRKSEVQVMLMQARKFFQSVVES